MATASKVKRTHNSLRIFAGRLFPRVAIMDRYLAMEMLPPFLFGVGAFSSIALAIGSLFELVRLITDAGLGILTAVKIFLLQLPGFMGYSFPMSVLLATLLAYSRLSSDGEITALRSCGVSINRLIAPALVLSVCVTGITFAFNEAIVPSANWQAKTTLQEALKQDNPSFQSRDIFYQQYGTAEDGKGGTTEGLVRSFYARRFDGTRMLDLTVMDFSQGKLSQIVSAESAVWLADKGVWQFRNGTTYFVDNNGNYSSILRFEQQELRLPRSPLDLAQERRSSEEMNIAELQRYINLVRQSGNAKEVTRLEVRLQQKFALPFVCTIFALVGAPLGMRPQRTGTAKGFGISIPIIFGYYLLIFVCGALGQVEVFSPVLAGWMPNILGLVTGLVLLSRVQ